MKILYLTTIFIICLHLISYSKVYRSAGDGSYDDPVWNPSQPPAKLLTGDSIIISHYINMNGSIEIQGVMLIESNARLENENKTLTIDYFGVVIVDGKLIVKSILNRGLLIDNGRISVYDNIVNDGPPSTIDGSKGIIRLKTNLVNNAGGWIKGTVNVCRFDEVTNPLVASSGIVDSTVTICGQNSSLPVSLSSFYADQTGKRILIQWSCSEELDNAFFQVQKSTDSRSFTTIAVVEGKGNNYSISNYTVEDDNINSSVIYYRLKQVDSNDDYRYSDVISVSIQDDQLASFRLFPNPFTPGAQLYIESLYCGESRNVTVKILDQSGREVLRQDVIDVCNGSNIHAESIPSLSAGIYHVIISDQDIHFTEKLVVK